MFTLSRTAKQLALASLLASFGLCVPPRAPAQTSPSAPANSTPAGVREVQSKDGSFLIPTYLPAVEALQATPANPPATGGVVPTPNPDVLAQTGEQRQQDAKPEGWANVPPNLHPTPRPGWFILPPSGCGYYTALDCLRGTEKDKPPPYPYRNPFYDNDFRYLDKPDGKPVDFLDRIKRVHLGGLFDPCADNWILSIGGEERYQLKNEIDSRLTARDNRYDLLRTRVYGDLWYKDQFRVYVEYIDAQSFNEDLPPLPIDVNRSDLLNAFIDVKVWELNGNPIYARIGRQELLYGSQRLISPLDWANTRRTFDGAKVFYRSDKFDLDVFYTMPVNVSPSHFDAADWNRHFAGAWATYRPEKGKEIDAYYLYLEQNLRVPFGYTPGGRAGYDFHTVGGRYSGDRKLATDGCTDRGSFLWDFEGALQFGDWSNRNVFAGMGTAGLGYQATQLAMSPSFWIYYDYASGAANPTGTGTFSDFNQLFPFGHYYFGYLDFVGRTNIRDLNFQAAAFPTKWITALAQYHIFDLDEPRSPLFGTPPNFFIQRSSPTGVAGIEVGEELDLMLNLQLGRHSNVLLGYSKFFEGNFIRKSGPSVSPELYYFQYAFRW